ncbi:hypothetical protein [Streptomyces sp. GC420]|uniref:hypothetical protein n=1 Tax=Streptomyces sp. GC420 TaxID=2697568 RepID=UPI001414FC32|nr:hypothetical protein [Streptomyces sp. GC420]NBM16168.1 hypothetical protein [Streptomyces sp. GC420]
MTGNLTAVPVGHAAAPWRLKERDVAVGTVIVIVLCTTFTWLSSGASLLVTFLPGAAFAWLALVYLYRSRQELPETAAFLPVYVLALSIQFVHFAEEYVAGFPTDFALLYGGRPYDSDLFVVFNMSAYAVFAAASVLAFTKRLGFMLVPVLFFLMYGAIGNAIAHTCWSIMAGGYYPGLFTAQLFWIAGPWTLSTLTGGRHRGLVIGLTAAMAAVMVPLLAAFADTGYHNH